MAWMKNQFFNVFLRDSEPVVDDMKRKSKKKREDGKWSDNNK